MEWKERTMQYWPTINAMATRRFGRGPLAEEAALAVIDGLASEQWRRVRAFSGRSSFSAYIRALSARLLEDFARRRFGRRRPPLWLQTFGGFWLRLFQALCLERLPSYEAVERVRSSWQAEPPPNLEEAAHQILARIPDCGTAQGEETELAEEHGVAGEGSAEIAERRQQEELLQAVASLLLNRQDKPPQHLVQRYRDLHLDLSGEEILLLRLCYQDGLSVAEAGKKLGLNRFQAHGRLRRLLQRLREQLVRCGLAEAFGFS